MPARILTFADLETPAAAAKLTETASSIPGSCTAPGSAGPACGSGSPRVARREKIACIATCARRLRLPPGGEGEGSTRSRKCRPIATHRLALLPIRSPCSRQAAATIRLCPAPGRCASAHRLGCSDLKACTFWIVQQKGLLAGSFFLFGAALRRRVRSLAGLCQTASILRREAR